MDNKKDLQNRAIMTVVYLILVLWFLYAAYTEATGKWVTFPAREADSAAAPERGDTPLQTEPTEEEPNNG